MLLMHSLTKRYHAACYEKIDQFSFDISLSLISAKCHMTTPAHVIHNITYGIMEYRVIKDFNLSTYGIMEY